MAKHIVRAKRIEQTILEFRGKKIIIDADLATIYGTSTNRLNQAVRRNKNRFPHDFMFQLNDAEKDEVVTNCDHLINELNFQELEVL